MSIKTYAVGKEAQPFKLIEHTHNRLERLKKEKQTATVRTEITALTIELEKLY